MKRLIKKAQFYNADNLYNYEQGKEAYTEIFYNPTGGELQDTCQYEPRFMVRMYLTQSGELYAWNGGVLHHEVKDIIKGSSNYIHIDYDGESIVFTNIGPSDEFIQAVKNADITFNNAGINIDTPIKLGGYGNMGKLSECKTLDDIYNL